MNLHTRLLAGLLFAGTAAASSATTITNGLPNGDAAMLPRYGNIEPSLSAHALILTTLHRISPKHLDDEDFLQNLRNVGLEICNYDAVGTVLRQKAPSNEPRSEIVGLWLRALSAVDALGIRQPIQPVGDDRLRHRNAVIVATESQWREALVTYVQVHYSHQPQDVLELRRLEADFASSGLQASFRLTGALAPVAAE
jgi:hypothetical protein